MTEPGFTVSKVNHINPEKAYGHKRPAVPMGSLPMENIGNEGAMADLLASRGGEAHNPFERREGNNRQKHFDLGRKSGTPQEEGNPLPGSAESAGGASEEIGSVLEEGLAGIGALI